MSKDTTKWIVFITGTFIGNNCWDDWKLYFENKGYYCISPAWPNKDGSPEELRNRHPDPAIAANRLNHLTEYFTEIVNELPEKPILIGHSLGGLIVELLLQQGIGMAGVVVHSFPSANFSRSYFPIIKALFPTMGFLSPTQKSYMISFRKWKCVCYCEYPF